MKSNRIATLALALAVTSAAPLSATAQSDDAAFNRMVLGFTQKASQWVNPIRPEASVDHPGVASAVSADEQFMRAIAYYTRDMLDRAGWVNAYAPSPAYASGNYLLATRIGDGVTITAHA